MPDQKKDQVRVEDKRHFDKDGNVVRPENEKQATPDTPEPSSYEPGTPQKIDFISVLFTYVHTALIALGEVPDPIQKKPSEDLEAAQQMIDILELMEAKTKGNLNEQEKQYLESALFDLRMRFMKKTKRIQ